jgi:transcriptional regulator with XRE-family HTH domain
MAQPSEFRQIQLVGRKIRQLRKERQQTQTELAARLGIQQSDLSRMEKGEYRVSLDTLFKILAEFRIGVGEFFDEVARESVTPHDLRLLSDFHELDATSQNEVESYIHDQKLSRRRVHRDPPAPQASASPRASQPPGGGWNRTGTA